MISCGCGGERSYARQTAYDPGTYQHAPITRTCQSHGRASRAVVRRRSVQPYRHAQRPRAVPRASSCSATAAISSALATPATGPQNVAASTPECRDRARISAGAMRGSKLMSVDSLDAHKRPVEIQVAAPSVRTLRLVRHDCRTTDQ